jgi:hypothetical protein
VTDDRPVTSDGGLDPAVPHPVFVGDIPETMVPLRGLGFSRLARPAVEREGTMTAALGSRSMTAP